MLFILYRALQRGKKKQPNKIIFVFSSGQILMAYVHEFYMNTTNTNKKQLWTEYMIHIPFRLSCYLNIFKQWILYAVVMQWSIFKATHTPESKNNSLLLPSSTEYDFTHYYAYSVLNMVFWQHFSFYLCFFFSFLQFLQVYYRNLVSTPYSNTSTVC